MKQSPARKRVLSVGGSRVLESHGPADAEFGGYTPRGPFRWIDPLRAPRMQQTSTAPTAAEPWRKEFSSLDLLGTTKGVARVEARGKPVFGFSKARWAAVCAVHGAGSFHTPEPATRTTQIVLR
jgi:hypothetical protein